MKRLLMAGAAAIMMAMPAMAQKPKIYVAFQWHMHQPIYYPGEDVLTTNSNGHYDGDINEIFTSRTGAYTSWPANAVNKLVAANIPGGAQVSFSGSLAESLNLYESKTSHFKGWKSHWQKAVAQKTPLGNKRLDLVGFGYHHPLMALIDTEDVARQIRKHREYFAEIFPGMSYSKGIFPPENAFEEHLVKTFVNEDLEWVFVDNTHFDRTCEGYPWVNGFSQVQINKAEVQNPNPNDWAHIDGLYCPGHISAGFSHRPHRIKYVDPADGKEYRMIAVPTSMVFGNEDGRGGFGALQYEKCISQLEPYNTDPEHPILVVMHHDGDNHGGGSEAYYTSNFQNFISWLKANPDRYECTTVDDYLAMFPPAEDDVIHVEAGSWWGAGADCEFQKWNGDKGKYPGATEPYSPDHNSWSVITAASNIVKTASAARPDAAEVAAAWDYLMVGETSCYWYWDGTDVWDSKPTIASNLAVKALQPIMSGMADKTGPSIYHPQREPYNPGAIEWDTQMPSDFTVWTYVYDHSGLKNVTLKYRIDKDGVNPLTSNQNETYAGGDEVGAWQSVAMNGKQIPSLTTEAPLAKADEYSAQIKGLNDVLVDYYVEAEDKAGNITRSEIFHVWVGKHSASNPGGDDDVNTVLGSYVITPANPSPDDVITVSAPSGSDGMILHWGVNKFERPIEAYLPEGSVYHSDNKAARTPFVRNAEGVLEAKIGPFNNPEQEVSYISFVTNTGNSWDNNGGQDYKFNINKNTSVSGISEAEYPFSAVLEGDIIRLFLPKGGVAYDCALYSLSGAIVNSGKAEGADAAIDAPLSRGVYVIVLTDTVSGRRYSAKIVK